MSLEDNSDSTAFNNYAEGIKGLRARFKAIVNEKQKAEYAGKLKNTDQGRKALDSNYVIPGEVFDPLEVTQKKILYSLYGNGGRPVTDYSYYDKIAGTIDGVEKGEGLNNSNYLGNLGSYNLSGKYIDKNNLNIKTPQGINMQGLEFKSLR